MAIGVSSFGGMAQLQALIFDVDGTLAETERDGHRVAFNRAFAEVGLDWNWSVGLYGSLLRVSGGKERIRYFMQRYLPRFQPQEELETFIRRLHQTKNKHFKAILQRGMIPLRPGVKRLIAEAQAQGVRLAIATTSALENVMALLETTLGPESPGWFEVIAAGDMVAAKKPAPDIYQLVLAKLALPPGRCLAIEDSQQGLTAATAAGLTTLVTVNDYTRNQPLQAARLVVNHLGDPTHPVEVLAGDAYHAYYVSLELAQSLLSPPKAHVPSR